MPAELVELLLVEDDVGDILLIVQALREEDHRVSVHVAVDGEQAIQMIEKQYVKPDIVILDLNLPKISGLSFLGRCQLDAPVVVFTAFPSAHSERLALELGVKEVIEKPTDLDAFTGEVARIVRTWAPPKGNATSVN